MKMKYLWSVMLLLVVLENQCCGQNDNVKYDRNCTFGVLEYGNCIMTVEQDTYLIKKRPTMSLNASSTVMSDKSGNLQFYSNGISINNRIHYTMKNGKRINPGKFLDNGGWTDPKQGGLPSVQGLLSLPSPINDSIYYLFNMDILLKRYTNPTNAWVVCPEFYYQKIDMTKGDGFGEVVELNQLITGDTLDYGSLTACRHANGRDWWILVNELKTNVYRRYLLDQNGVNFNGKQTLPEIEVLEDQKARTTRFTPDGNHFVRVDHDSIPRIYIMDFDRCTGTLGKAKLVNVNHKGGLYTWSSISPNSRFIYLIQQEIILQLDLWATDIAASMDTVAVFDGYTSYNGCQTRFFQSWLGPDGRIYLSTGPCGSYHLHFIDKPDEKGKACDVRQHSIDLTVLNARTVPNFPNYRLGALKGSPCDTLTVASKEISAGAYGLKVLPNPASDRIQIEINLPNYDPSPSGRSISELVIVDANGSIVQRYTMPEYAYLATLEVSTLESGVYGVQLRQQNRVLAVEKLVVVR